MPTRVRIVLGVVLVAIVGSITWQVLHVPKREQDPIIDGKPLGTWLVNLKMSEVEAAWFMGYRLPKGSMTIILKSEVEAERALLKAGTNAIPTLLRMLRQKDWPFEGWVMGLLQRQHLFKAHYVSATWRNQQAALGFATLAKVGTDAGMAVPKLTAIYERRFSVSSCQCAASSLGVFGPAAQSAIPALVRGLADRNPSVRASTAVALGNIHSKPEVAVPALVKCLSDPDFEVRGYAALGLKPFGVDARQAVPALVLLLHGDLMSHFYATKALKAIDPEAAAKAGVK
jgi:hypothetical protein